MTSIFVSLGTGRMPIEDMDSPIASKSVSTTSIAESNDTSSNNDANQNIGDASTEKLHNSQKEDSGHTVATVESIDTHTVGHSSVSQTDQAAANISVGSTSSTDESRSASVDRIVSFSCDSVKTPTTAESNKTSWSHDEDEPTVSTATEKVSKKVDSHARVTVEPFGSPAVALMSAARSTSCQATSAGASRNAGVGPITFAKTRSWCDENAFSSTSDETIGESCSSFTAGESFSTHPDQEEHASYGSYYSVTNEASAEEEISVVVGADPPGNVLRSSSIQLECVSRRDGVISYRGDAASTTKTRLTGRLVAFHDESDYIRRRNQRLMEIRAGRTERKIQLEHNCLSKKLGSRTFIAFEDHPFFLTQQQRKLQELDQRKLSLSEAVAVKSEEIQLLDELAAAYNLIQKQRVLIVHLEKQRQTDVDTPIPDCLGKNENETSLVPMLQAQIMIQRQQHAEEVYQLITRITRMSYELRMRNLEE